MLKREPLVVSHWHKLFTAYHTSSQDFYGLVEEAIRRREVPNARLSRVAWREGGVISAEREYLRVSRERLNFDICAAPFGTGFFFSWWLARLPIGVEAILYYLVILGVANGALMAMYLSDGCSGIGLSLFIFFGLMMLLGGAVRLGRVGSEEVVLNLPYVGPLYEKIFQPQTYFRSDSEIMFQEAVHEAVLEVIESLTMAHGFKALSDSEREPTYSQYRKHGDDESAGALAS